MQKDRSLLPADEPKIAKNIGKNDQFLTQTAHNMHNERSSRKPKMALKYLISEEIHALLSACARNPRDHAIFRLAYHHGLRAAEIGKIQFHDYRPSPRVGSDYLYIARLKGSIGGDTVLVPAAALAIRKYVQRRGDRPGALFLSQRKTGISRRRLDELMKRYCKTAHISPEKAHFHALKHTCATMLLSVRKESIVDVQHHLGHADIRSTMVYAQLTEQANEERAARLRNWK